MTCLTGQSVTQKPEKVRPDPDYLAAVHQLPCCVCGRQGVEAHHCRDLPEFSERGLYQRLPAGARKSGDRDAIPLCVSCHRLFHERRSEFHEIAGKDYGFIGPTRALITDGEVDF